MSLETRLTAIFQRIAQEFNDLKAEPLRKEAIAVGANAVVTHTASPGKRVEVTSITFAYDQDPTNGQVTLDIDGVTSSLPVQKAGPGPVPVGERTATDGTVTVTLDNGGAGIEGTIWLHYKEV